MHVISSDVPILDIVGVHVTDLTEADALSYMHDRIDQKEHTKVGFLNAHNANIAQENPTYNEVLKTTFLMSDGIGVDIAAKILHGNKFKANLNGTDFIPALLRSARKPIKVALYGAKPGVADGAAKAFMAEDDRHDIRVLGHGYIDADAQVAMLEEMKRWKPDVVLVAMGVPLQEIWIEEHITAEHTTLAYGIGALFDFAAGNVKRAPQWMRDVRLEWLHRLFSEPRRLFKRYVIGNPLFLYHVAKYKFARTEQKEAPNV